jgi:hypothetical protein
MPGWSGPPSSSPAASTYACDMIGTEIAALAGIAGSGLLSCTVIVDASVAVTLSTVKKL